MALGNKQFQKLKQVFHGEILVDEPLSKHTTFKIGGPAACYLYPGHLEELIAVTEFCKQESIPRFVIGKGSNLLVSDNGYPGIVIDLSKTFDAIRNRENVVTVGSGVLLGDLIKYTIERGLSGLERLTGIPGQIGGCITLNAGAWGSETGDHLDSVSLLDRYGTVETKPRREIEIGYRKTILPEESIVIEADFLLTDGNPTQMKAIQRSLMQERKSKQPLSLPSAGSVFKRPTDDYAGRLIEESGCKGLRIGDAMVSKKHANFIVNCRLASAQDVLRLIQEIQSRVIKRFGVELELEIHMIGFGDT